MAQLISIMGSSGTGKSTSILHNEALGIIGLDPKETVVINVAGKPLPAKGSNKTYPLGVKLSQGGNHVHADKAWQIVEILTYINNSRPDIKNIVIDDCGYVMGFDVMENSSRKGFDKWVDFANNFMTIITSLQKMRDDIYAFCVFHTEVGKDGKTKIKTAGNMIDTNIYLDGLFTVNLEAEIKKIEGEIKFGFYTRPDEYTTRKSPVGMFDSELIPNDLGYVRKTMEEYFG